MANPHGTFNHGSSNQAPASFNGAGNNSIPINGITGHDNSSVLKHNPGVSAEWTPEEQAILEDGLNQFGGESSILCYAKIAMKLRGKTVRDVAMRSRWMTKKEHCKRRKEDNIPKKGKEKKEKVHDSAANASHFAGHSNISSFGNSPIPLEYTEGFSFIDEIGGLRGELLDENARAFSKVQANLATLEALGPSQPIYESHPMIQENMALLSKIRANINRIMIDMNEMPEIMNQMPALPVKMNENLANAALLPPQVHPPPPPSNHHR